MTNVINSDQLPDETFEWGEDRAREAWDTVRSWL